MLKTEKRKINFSALSECRAEIYGLCIIWIMLYHAQSTQSFYPGILNRIISIGDFGCDIFIFLSAVSLCFSFEKKPVSLSAYYKKRLKRIYPPLIFVIIYWLISMLTGDLTVFDFLSSTLSMELWLTGGHMMWFISEILFLYFVFPYVYSFIYDKAYNAEKQNSTGILLKTCCLIFLIFIVIFVIKTEAPVFYDYTVIALSRIPVFVLGVAFGKKVICKKDLLINDYLIGVLMLIAACLLCIAKAVFKFSILSDMPAYYVYFFLTFPAMVLFAGLKNILKIKPISAILKWFGEMSIECYIVHITLVKMYRLELSIPYKYEEGNILKYLGVIAISIVVAYLWHRVIAFSQKKLSGMLAHKKNI